MTSGSVSRHSQVQPTSLLVSYMDSRHVSVTVPQEVSKSYLTSHILQGQVSVTHQRCGEQPSRGAANAWSPAVMIVH